MKKYVVVISKTYEILLDNGNKMRFIHDNKGLEYIDMWVCSKITERILKKIVIYSRWN